jgi:hypothetical protein
MENASGEDAQYFNSAMEPIYEKVRNMLGGIGAAQKRVQEFEELVCGSGGVWNKVQKDVEAALNKLLKSRAKSLTGFVDKLFDDIINDVKVKAWRTSEEEAQDKLAEQKFTAELKAAVREARSIVDGPVKRLADQCEAYGKVN